MAFLADHQLDDIPVKVGMELYFREGPAIIHKLKDKGHAIFLDLKLHDIPHTVYNTMVNLSKLDVDMVNIHAAGGSAMIQAAKSGLEDGSFEQRPLLTAVTQLTSTDAMTFQSENLTAHSIEEAVLHYADLAKHAGADGVVSAVGDVSLIKQQCGSSFITVSPGIRLANDSMDDQKRVSDPGMAYEAGSDAIVVGRAVTRSADPKDTYERIRKEFQNVPHTRR
ncbi:orotidine-5'-phosphate decarboxylase [Thalassobacillus sp. CUG 92003]|uniref:orotidine-5'-phosphate decarboxylase n=1 Tax=Thalassobacillus sp. CUG 92003 TaxID=2736641 RepID=UPI001C6266AD|nr:orotidine-5'-phosphate decarboxylase [Thalassobacillus sp. CUG 92003]